jgi:hypothetical protein
MLAIIKNQAGCFIGSVLRKEFTVNQDVVWDLSVLHYPCIIDFIPVPVQGRIAGQTGLASVTSAIPWPDVILNCNTEPTIYSLISEDSKNNLVTLYLKTVNETWKKGTN